MSSQLNKQRLLRYCLLSLLLASATSTSVYAEEAQVSPITDIYSDIDTRLKLAIKADAEVCEDLACEDNLAFDQRIQALGLALTKAAIIGLPEQEARLSRMKFSVVEKRDAGIASNNKGRIMVFRGLQDMQLSDDALAFIMAREMGHVLAGHHRTNTSTKLMISALASVLFPAVAIVAASSTAAQASTATTLITSAASTATSVIGGEVAVSTMKSTQLSQSVDIALRIMQHGEWNLSSACSVLHHDAPPQNGWWRDMEMSRDQLELQVELEASSVIPVPQQHAENMQFY
ncbi:MAG: M48 family metalloprotease [Methylophilaceae bacterium]|nr:M48 family metalloprotease [Methylophilaceae bacterium]